MTDTSDLLNDFIAILKDGLLFYEDAIERIGNPKTRALFERMITLRKKAILELAPHVRSEGDRVRVMGTLVGTIHKEYTQIAGLLGDPEDVYLSELAALEERTLDALKETISSAPAGEAHSALADQVEGFQRSLMEMRSFKP